MGAGFVGHYLLGPLVVLSFGELFVLLVVWLLVWLEGVLGWCGCVAGSFGLVWLAWLNPPTPGPKPRGPHKEGSGRGPVALKGCLGGPGCCKHSGAAFNCLF